jgi:hypothetical protein
LEEGQVVYNVLREKMPSPWNEYSLDILITDTAILDAWASSSRGRDTIYITRGAIERIYGTTLGLLSVSSFMPAIGNPGAEVVHSGAVTGGFAPLLGLRRGSDSAEEGSIWIPQDEARIAYAHTVAELALNFLVYHEMGHIVGGHLELPREPGELAYISEAKRTFAGLTHQVTDQVLECDADAFACDTSALLLVPRLINDAQKAVNPSMWPPQHYALVTYLVSIGILFRSVYPEPPETINAYEPSHPHPAVRACLTASCAMARLLAKGTVTPVSLDEVMRDSIQNIEETWATLRLPGQSPELSEAWGQSVGEASRQLFRSYSAARTVLGQYARLPRKWDNWDWPA